MERTIEDLGKFLEHHSIVNLRVQRRNGVFELNWQQKNKERKQLENDDFALAIAAFMETVATEAS